MFCLKNLILIICNLNVDCYSLNVFFNYAPNSQDLKNFCNAKISATKLEDLRQPNSWKMYSAALRLSYFKFLKDIYFNFFLDNTHLVTKSAIQTKINLHLIISFIIQRFLYTIRRFPSPCKPINFSKE